MSARAQAHDILFRQGQQAKAIVHLQDNPIASEHQMRAAGVPYYARCTLQLDWKTRHGQSSKDFLVIHSGKEKSSAYCKDAVWLISAERGFHADSPAPWLRTAVVRACWHGPNHDGRYKEPH